jgi:hypothetical protein
VAEEQKDGEHGRLFVRLVHLVKTAKIDLKGATLSTNLNITAEISIAGLGPARHTKPRHIARGD